MNKVLKRLKSKAGESLIESMAAILIFTFGSIIMLTMVSTAADINTTAKEEDRSYYEQMVVVEMAQTESATPGTVSISINDSAKKTTIPVKVYRKANVTDSLYAYYEAEGGSGS